MMRHWIGVASAEHVALGREAGFMQLCHGKGGPLRKVAPGDGIAYYSPSSWMRGGERMQAFTAIGTVAEGEPYQVEMAPGFLPFRRAVHWVEARQAAIHPLLPRLAFTTGGPNWGYRFRFGFFEVDKGDFAIVAEAMQAQGFCD